MKKIQLIIGMLLCLLCITNAYPSDKKRWSIKIEPGYTNLYWYEHMFDIYTLSIIEDSIVTTEDPIILRIPRKTTMGLEIKYKWSRWELGMRGWMFSSSIDQKDKVTSPGYTIQEDGTNAFIIKCAKMWDYALIPVNNTQVSSMFSPVWYLVKNKFSIWTYEAFASVGLTKSLRAIFGLELIKMYNQQTLGQKQHAYIDLQYFTYTFNNHITLLQQSRAVSQILGPSTGLQLCTKHFEASFKYAALYNITKRSGSWIDIDDATFTNRYTKELYWTQYYNGQYPFERKTKSVIPHAELNLKLFHTFYISNNTSFKIGFGFFVSRFWDVPIAPKWSSPGEWHWAGNSHWNIQKQNLTFSGFTINSEINFCSRKILSKSIQAENQYRWNIQIEPVFMNIYPNAHMGDIYTYSFAESEIPKSETAPGKTTFNYGTKYDPIAPAISRKVNIIWELSHKPKNTKWEYSIRGWQLNSSARENDSIAWFKKKINEDGTINYFLSGARMWDFTFEPFSSSTELPIDYQAKNHLRIWVRETYIHRNFTNKFGVKIGIKIADIGNQHILSQKHRKHNEEHEKYTLKTYTMLAQTSRTDYLIAGPVLGISFRTAYINACLSQGVLFGTAAHSGFWEYIDKFERTNAETGEFHEIFDANEKHTLKTLAWNTIPTTELHIKLGKKFAFNNTYFTLGFGIFASTFWQTPIAPSWSIPWDWDGKESNWNIEKENLTFTGLTVNLGVSF